MKSKIITYGIAFIWLINGLYCKVLGLVPRHQQIVERIMGVEYGDEFTFAIGVAEILMAVWILSGYRKQLNALFQIIVIAVMNVIEFFLAHDLLLWGRANAFFALLLICIIYYNSYKSKNI